MNSLRNNIWPFQVVLPFVMLLIMTVACHADNQILLTSIEHNNTSFKLFNDNGKCAIRLNNGTAKQLGIPWPCGFVRSDKKMVAQTHHYSKVGQVFIIAGPPAAKSDYHPNAGVTPDHLCSNHGQAIIYQTGKLILRKAQNIPLGFCHQLGFDEKDYYGYAYPVE